MEEKETFQCSSLHGEKFYHPDYKSMVAESSTLWLQHRVGSLESWVLTVKDYFSVLDPTSHWICMVALSACPLLVRTPNQLRIMLSLPQACHILPYGMNGSIEEASPTLSLCGYDEEQVLCTFIQEVYSNNWTLLAKDVETAYRHLVACSHLSHGIRYLHNRICKSSRLPPYIEMVTRLPYDKELIRLVRDMVKFVMECSGLKKTSLITHMLTKPITVTNDIEWKVIQECRNICGFRWHARYVRDMKLVFGNLHWMKQWHSTFVRTHLNMTHFEMWEERVVWVSVWLARLRRGMIKVDDSPKMLLFRFGTLLI